MNVFYLLILVASMAVMQCLVGGTRLLFCLPAFGLLALAAIGAVLDIRRRKVAPNGACVAASAVFFGYLIARGLTSPVAYLAWPDLFSILGSLTVYLLVACHLTDSRRRLWVLAGLLVLAGVNLFVAARQFASGTGFMLFGFLRSEAYLGRASGLFICPNHLAGFLEVMGSIALAAAIWSRAPSWVKLLFGYGALCCFGGLLMTASRGGFLSSGVALLTIAGLGLRRSRETSPGAFWRILVSLLVAAALVGGGVTFAARKSNVIGKRGAMIIDRGDVRTLMWPAAIKQFQLSPWVGTGAGSYLYYGRLFRDPRLQADPVHAHNDYLELLGEYGALGAGGLLLFLAAHLRWGWAAYRHLSLRPASRSASGGSNAAALNIGALAATAAMAAHSVVDFNLHIPANAMLMAFVFGVLANPGRDLSDAGSEATKVRGWQWLPRIALPALGVVLLTWGLPKLPGEYYCERARVALRDNKPFTALNEATLGLEREQRNPFLFFYLGEARQAMADRSREPALVRSFREAALDPYRRAVTLSPYDIRFLLRLGNGLIAVGELPEAGQVVDEALKWDPLSGRVQTYYGFYLQHAGRLADAEAAYARALDLTPNDSATEGYKRVKEALAAGGQAD